MRITYTTTFDATDVHNWSGTPYHMSHALQQAGMQVNYIGNLKRKLPRFFKAKQVLKKYLSNQRESPRFNTHVAKAYSQQVAKQLQTTCDVIVSPLINPIAYLETSKPIVLWTDALYAALLGFYEPFSTHSLNTINQGNAMTRACLSRCSKLVFSSDWAANSAIELYGANPEKVHVIPFGANIQSFPNADEVEQMIRNRSQEKINLLFLAKSWERKGGDKVLAVAKALHQSGHAVELNIVGYQPPNLKTPPSYVNCLGFISKHTQAGKEKLRNILANTHFLFVPSIAEAYGIVFCEANAYGIPCLTSGVGGINTIIKNNINGLKYALDAPAEKYCTDILLYMQDRKKYEEFAKSSYNEFVTRLNWNVAAQEFKNLLQQL